MKEKVIKIMLGWVEHNEPIETTADKLLDLFAVSGLLRNDRIKEVAKEIANSKTKGFSEEWEKFREEEYKYWLKRIRWATRSNDR